MIQINLLPDVKREYLRSQQMKHLFIVGAVLVSMAAIALLVLLFLYVQVWQPTFRTKVQKDIDTSISDIKAKDDAVKMVTVQGVLQQITGLQDKKQISSKAFDYLKSFTPRDVAYDKVSIDLTTMQLSLSGNTTSYQSANVLANNLKSAQFTYTKNDVPQTIKPFDQIVFKSLSQATQSSNNRPVSFQIDMTFKPDIFAQDIKDVKLKVDASSDKLLIPSDKPFSNDKPNNSTPLNGASQ